MPDFLAISKPLIERGFSIIPIEKGGKRPVQGVGVTKRTRFWTQVFNWSQTHGNDLNVGICADENTVILETDDFEQLCQVVQAGAGERLPVTLTACGSSENRPHLFFKRTEKSTHVGNLVVPGLFEARFNNQYVVGPGSVHPTGAVYRWLSDVPIVPIPDWLVSELARLSIVQKGSTPTRPEINREGSFVVEGSRHYFLMRELGRLWSGSISEEELTEKAFELNSQCDPPKDSAHVLQCVRDIMRREPYDPGPTVVLGSTQKEEEKKTGWPVVTARSFKAEVIPPREAVVKEGESVLFYESSVNQMLAWRGVGKTNFGMALAGMIATGSSLLNFNAPRPRKVLYIDGELPKAQLQERVKSFVADEHDRDVYLISPDMMEPKRSINLLTPSDESALTELIEKAGIEVVFIDSQSTAMKGDSLESTFQESHLGILMRLRWSGLCVIEMHHVGKGGLQRGSSRNDDILDVQMHLKKLDAWEPEDGLAFEIEYLKVRHAAALESGYVVSLVGNEWTKRPTDELAYAAELFNKELGVREVAKKLKISTGKAGNLRKKALKLGLVNSSIPIEIAGVKSGKEAK